MIKPKIDKRSYEDIIEDVQKIAPFYVPEMGLENKDFASNKGAEIALINIFANMMSIIIDRLNKVPDMNFIAFLDMLGMKLLPPNRASAPITFYLTEGVPKSVLIPSKTQVASGDVIFETEKNIFATPSKLVEIYSCDGEDNIFKCPSNVISGETSNKLKTTLLTNVESGKNEIIIDNPQGIEENNDFIIKNNEKEHITVSKIIKIKLSSKLKNEYKKGTLIEISLPEKYSPNNIFKTKLSKDVEIGAYEIEIDDFEEKEEIFSAKCGYSLTIRDDSQKILQNDDIDYRKEYSNVSRVIDNKIKLSSKLKNGYLKDSLVEILIPHKSFPDTILKSKLSKDVEVGADEILIDDFNVKKEIFSIKCGYSLTIIDNHQVLEDNDEILIVKDCKKEYLKVSRVVDNNVKLSTKLKNGHLKGSQIEISPTDDYSLDNVLKTKLSEDVEVGVDEILIDDFKVKEEIYSIKCGYSLTIIDNPQIVEKNNDLIISDCKKEYLTVSEVIDNKVILFDELKNNYSEGSSIEKITTFNIFKRKNLQEHILYLGHDNLFNFKNKSNKSILTIVLTTQDIVDKEHIKNLKWDYWNGEKWDNFKNLTYMFWDGQKWKYYDGNNLNDLTNIKEINALQGKEKEILFKFSLEEGLSIHEKSINGINSFWIRCIGGKEQLVLENINVFADLTDYPDSCFINNIPLNIEKNEFYPFGKEPKIYDTFYIASNNSFSNKGEDIILQIEYSYTGSVNYKDPLFSYEYWNGNGWDVLNVEIDNFLPFVERKSSISLEFKCPSDIEPTEVNGNHNHWIKFKMLNNGYSKISENGFEYNAPQIYDISITLKANEKLTDKVLTFNDLEFKNLSYDNETKKLEQKNIFTSPKKDKSIYFGFDSKIEGGPISLFFSLEENELSFDNIASFKWKYFSNLGKWLNLDVVDETFGLNREGTIEFLFPKDLEKTIKFGKELYWIKALQVKEQQDIKLEGSDNMGGNSSNDSNPVLKKVLLNTTLATHSETIKDEILGTSDGNQSQKFTLNRSPIISEEVWVNEVSSISEKDINSIKNDKIFLFEEKKDIKGNITEFWVKWKNVDNIDSSSSYDRHYEIDKFSQLIKFGNGINGLIPPMGNNIKANYNVGGGSEGNLPIESIDDLKSSVPSIDKVVNLIESSGGSNRETIEQLMERGSNVLKHRNRGVTTDDFEKIVTGYFKDIAKVKCITNIKNNSCISKIFSNIDFNEFGLIIVFATPKTDVNIRPNLSLYHKKQIENYLMEHALNILRFQVLDPIYVEVKLTVRLATLNIEYVPEIIENTNNALKRFLNPINGGNENDGWKFGELPCFNDFYTILDDIRWVDYVKNISMSFISYDKDEIISEVEIYPENISKYNLCQCMVIYSGEHDITVEKSGGDFDATS